MRHNEWFPADPAAVVDLARDGAIVRLVDRYCGHPGRADALNRRKVLLSVLARAYDNGARTAVVEFRYTDIDYRDEHSRFYAQTFRHYPSIAHRLHFFREDAPQEVAFPDVAAVFDSMEYMGYSVLRPVPGAVVGRTVLGIPNAVRSSVTCGVRDSVNFFGRQYEIVGVPFIAQDGQLSSCAHAAAWTVAYFHSLRYGGARVLPGDLADAVPSALTIGRTVPTPGLLVEQLSDALEAVGLPPLVYWVHDSSTSYRDFDKIARRYLDSGLPLIVGTATHAYTLVGYVANTRGPATFIIQDDEVGPYQVRTRPAFHRSPEAWRYLLAPAPDQLYLPCGPAEQVGRAWLKSDLERASTSEDPRIAAEARTIIERLKTRFGIPENLGFVTSAIRSNEFKRTLMDRGYSSRVARGYMRLPMSKWIWVIEIVDRQAFRNRRHSVIAEAVIDCTEHDRDRHALAWRVPGLLQHWNGDDETISEMVIEADQPRAMSVCASSTERSLETR